MTLHQLKIFVIVARVLNVTTAAKQLNISQPTVSLQIKMLEEEIGCQFFERSNHGVALTEQGHRFLDAILPALERLDAVKTDFAIQPGKQTKHRLIVGANNTLTDIMLPDILTDFKNLHPEVRIIVKTGDSRSLETSLRESKIDIGLITEASFFPDFIYESLEEYEPVAFVPHDSPIRQSSMTLAELARHPLIVRRDTQCFTELTTRGYKLNIALECDAPETVIRTVKRGWGVGFLFRARLARELSAGSIRAIDLPELDNVKRRSYIVYDGRKAPSPRAKDFVHVLRCGIERLRSPSSPPL